MRIDHEAARQIAEINKDSKRGFPGLPVLCMAYLDLLKRVETLEKALEQACWNVNLVEENNPFGENPWYVVWNENNVDEGQAPELAAYLRQRKGEG